MDGKYMFYSMSNCYFIFLYWCTSSAGVLSLFLRKQQELMDFIPYCHGATVALFHVANSMSNHNRTWISSSNEMEETN